MVVGRKGTVYSYCRPAYTVCMAIYTITSVGIIKLQSHSDCDILIAGDQSISRKHAIVHLTDGTVSSTEHNAKYPLNKYIETILS